MEEDVETDSPESTDSEEQPPPEDAPAGTDAEPKSDDTLPEDPDADPNAVEDPNIDPNATQEEPVAEPEPKEQNVSTADKTGVKLELSPSEDFDTLMYRLETIHKINALIEKNELDIKKISVLKHLKTFWIAQLSVQTIEDIMSKHAS